MTVSASSPPEGFVLTLAAVKRAITTLQPLKIHETFVAYLHLRRRATGLGRFTNLDPDWQGDPHKWMKVPGGPPNKEHFRPFTSRGASLNAFWMASNLAGSYAPSSLRDKRSLYVDSIDQYRLPTRVDGSPDPDPILSQLLFESPAPAWAVAAYVFRNRLFEDDGGDSVTPGWPDLLDVFQDFFRWTDDERDALFSWSHPDTPCFEEFDPNA